MVIDGAKVLYISKQSHYGKVKVNDKEIPICYVSIAKYDNSDLIYLLLCDINKDVIYDEVFNSIQEAKLHVYSKITKDIKWQ